MCVIGHADQDIGGVMGIEDLINNARAGQLALHMDDEAFNKLVTACDVYIDDLNDLYRQAMALADKPLGFSEGHLQSGADLARKFQEKASAPGNSAAATFKSHIDAAENFKTLFLAARAAYRQTDEHNASGFKLGDGH